MRYIIYNAKLVISHRPSAISPSLSICVASQAKTIIRIGAKNRWQVAYKFRNMKIFVRDKFEKSSNSLR